MRSCSCYYPCQHLFSISRLHCAVNTNGISRRFQFAVSIGLQDYALFRVLARSCDLVYPNLPPIFVILLELWLPWITTCKHIFRHKLSKSSSQAGTYQVFEKQSLFLFAKFIFFFCSWCFLYPILEIFLLNPRLHTTSFISSVFLSSYVWVSSLLQVSFYVVWTDYQGS